MLLPSTVLNLHIEKIPTFVFSFRKVSEKYSSFNPNMRYGHIYANLDLFIQTFCALHRHSH